MTLVNVLILTALVIWIMQWDDRPHRHTKEIAGADDAQVFELAHFRASQLLRTRAPTRWRARGANWLRLAGRGYRDQVRVLPYSPRQRLSSDAFGDSRPPETNPGQNF